MTRQRPPIALLLFLLSCNIYVSAATGVAPSEDVKNLKTKYMNLNEVSKVKEETVVKEIKSESQRKVEIPDFIIPESNVTDDDPYTIVEDSETCYWCGTDVPEDDDEHRAATIYTFSEYIAPGTCVTNKSPRYPAKYPNNVDYRWTYTTHAESVMTFSVPVGGLQISRGCHRDKLAVRVGSTVTKKCGQFYNFNINSRDKALMYVRFASNHRIRWHGYTGTICASALPETTTTSTTTTTQTTTTTTPPTPLLCDDICGNANGFSSRISQTNNAPLVYPWVITVDIMRDNVFVRCTGYLISRIHVVTAAYCFFQETPTGVDNVNVRVMAGEYDISTSETPAAQILYSDNVTLYDDFDVNNGGGVYNMAIITMPGKGFTLNSRVSPICLANAAIQADLVTISTTLSLAGFGWTEHDYPAINMTEASLLTCGFSWPDTDLICIFIRFQPSTPCHGDAGAAIFKEWTDGKIYAVAQINAITVDSCPLNGVVFPCPAVAFYRDWIDGVTGTRYCNND
ncbi:proclotting enzyme-like isoform X2 [Palaemon carinicauda]|uniref:proclotting enzyme-like isoform X2 n=1 Tax=Palaemon carinicauda TaxID=392227 RepID=UPI0035B5FF28